MTTALVADRVFDGAAMLPPHTVVVEGDRIAAIAPGDRGPRSAHRVECKGTLVPGFVDTQVNGGGGVLLNDAPTVETLATMVAAHRGFGTTGLLPTLISDRWERMEAAADAIAAARAAGSPGILGVHFEGPYLNAGRRGVHPAEQLRPIDDGFFDLVTRPDLGRVVVTLAPECVPAGSIAALVKAGVRVSVGHTMATHAQVVAALDEGASGFTHLFNAMSPLTSREPGTVGAALADPRGYCGIIVDGHHVDPVTLRIAVQARGADRMMLVTDAMSTVGSELREFDLFGQTVTRAGGRLTTADGTLAGSDLDMASAVRNAVEDLGLAEEDALAMASRTPLTFLGLDHDRGRIAPGHVADLTLLDAEGRVLRTWIGGRD